MEPNVEAQHLVAQHGRAAKQLLLDAITRAIKEQNDVEAIRLDKILEAVERLLDGF